jgi:hypothetical protein
MTSSAAAHAWDPYARLTALSLAALLATTVAMVAAESVLHTGSGDTLIAFRNFLGYGHFALAYIFAWRMIRRDHGTTWALAYLPVFLALVAAYAFVQRYMISVATDALFIMVIFMIHHGSNEILFREQSRNGYRPFDWTPRRILWVALAAWLVVVDRSAMPSNPLHPHLPFIATVWLGGWAYYGWRYLITQPSTTPARLGWAGLGGLVIAAAALTPSGAILFAKHRFAFLVIYHYLIWYVFYTRKLLARSGGWGRWPSGVRSLEDAWKAATTIPVGFLGLVLVGNVVLFGLFLLFDPVTQWAHATLKLDFFQVNTFAHVMFGVGLPSRAAAATTRAPDTSQTVTFA